MLKIEMSDFLKKTVIKFRGLLIVLLVIALLMAGNKIVSFFRNPEKINFSDEDPYPVIENETLELLDKDGVHRELASEKLEIYVDHDTGNIQVIDLDNGFVWRSDVEESLVEKDDSNSIWKSNMRSPVIIEYIQDFKANTPTYGNTVNLRASVDVYKLADDAVRISYAFADTGMKIALDIYLSGDKMEVVVPSYLIEEPEIILRENVQGELVVDSRKFFRITNISVFPFLGSGPSDIPDSYLFVPDGPGALIEFRQNRQFYTEYVGDVYGTDLAYVNKYDSSLRNALEKEKVYFPVFGSKLQENALACVIHDGSEYASIHGVPAGVRTDQNHVYADFSFRTRYKTITDLLGGGYFNYTESIKTYSPHLVYYFLEGDRANYSGIADSYRKYLIEYNNVKEIVSEETSLPLQLDIIGGDIQEKIFGKSFIPMTTFAQAEEIVDDLSEKGIANIDITYLGWSFGGITPEYPERFPVEGKLGGRSGLQDFADKMRLMGNQLILEDNNLNVTSFKGISARNDTQYNIHGSAMQITKKGEDAYFLSPDKIKDILSGNILKISDSGISGLRETGLGKYLNSDFSPGSMASRKQVLSEHIELAEIIDDNFQKAYYETPSAYLIGSDRVFSNMVMTHNYSPIIDKVVPVYHMAISSLMEYSTKPYNLYDEPRFEFLKAIEYGANIRFIVTYEETELLRHTGSKNFYSTKYSVWSDEITDIYAELNDIYAKVSGEKMISHNELQPNVKEIIYANGVRVYVNYNNYPVHVGKVQIEAMGFSVLAQE